MNSKTQFTRGHYDEIILNHLPDHTRTIVKNLVDGVARVQQQENGKDAWKFERRGGRALNYDVYGIGRDYHNRRTLAVVQLREWREGRYWNTTLRSYHLIGRNEDGSVFAHPVSSQVVRRAVSDGRCPVRAVQDWMFGADYTTILRQGDVALVPLSRKPVATVVESQELVVGDTHTLTAEAIARNGNYTYALNPHLRHERGEHADLCGEGWFKVVQAQSYSRPERRRFGRATYD